MLGMLARYGGVVIALITLGGCIIIETGDDVDNTDAVARASFSYEIPVDAQERVRLEAINGTIEITGEVGASSVVIAGERRVGSESIRDAEEHLAELEVEVDDRTTEVIVRTEQPSNTRGRNYVVDYTLTIPAELAVSIMHINGKVVVVDVAANTLVDLVNGNVDADLSLLPDGLVDLSAVNGNIDLAIPASTSADLDAAVTNGTIRTSNLVLQDVESSSRSLSGRLGTGEGIISLSVVNGNIAVAGRE